MTKIFSDGMTIKYPFPNAPEWIKLKIGIHADTFCEFLQKHKNEKGYVDIDVCSSAKTAGKLYGSLNTYRKSGDTEVKQEEKNREKLNELADEDTPPDEINPDEIPF